jgi:hypothetical protein
MKKQFCKIIELEDHFVTVMKWFDEADEDGTPYQIRVFIVAGGVCAELKFRYNYRESRDDIYEKFDTQTAQDHVEWFVDQIKGKEREE